MLYMPNCGTRDEEAGLVPPQLESRAARGSSRESRVVHYVIRTSVRASRRRGLCLGLLPVCILIADRTLGQ